MTVCPICQSPLSAGVCAACGYDISRDHLRFPTFAPLPEGAPILQPLPEDLLRCPECGALRIFHSAGGGLICANCRHEIPQPEPEPAAEPEKSPRLAPEFEQYMKKFCYSMVQEASPEQYPQIMDFIRSLELPADAVSELFYKVNNCLPYDLFLPRYAECFAAMGDWADALGMVSKKVALNTIYRELTSPGVSEEWLVQALADFSRQRFQFGSNLLKSELFEKLSQLTGKYAVDFENPRLAFMMLDLFRFSSPKQRQIYVSDYVEHSLKILRGQNLAERILFLTDIAVSPPSTFQEMPRVKQVTVQRYLFNALTAALPGYYAPDIEKRINRMTWYSSDIRSSALKMLKPADLKKSPQKDA